ncbi:hypothetical protein BC941DRAFT_508604 [Chlamydoabsidia padenii]|nr:hypothetical protein BC941DRAFT_508604 [Chlamydoabsidia padenii]
MTLTMAGTKMVLVAFTVYALLFFMKTRTTIFLESIFFGGDKKHNPALLDYCVD